jgi:L-fucose isomerase-like protein
MGFRDMRLYGTLYDGISLWRTVGVEVEPFEMLEMVQRAGDTSDDRVHESLAYIDAHWRCEKQPDRASLEQGCRYYHALADIVRERGYGAVTLNDVDGMKKLLDFPPSMLFMLLSDRLGVGTVPENDILGAATQLVLRQLSGQCAAYLEFYEFFTDAVLMGVPDYVPAEIVDGDTVISPNSFGGFAQSMLNVSTLKTSPVTLCRLFSRGGRYGMHVLRGEARSPRPWKEAGWEPPAPQLPSLEVALEVPVPDFARIVMGQHYMILYGDHVRSVKDWCRITGVDATA